MAAPPKDVAPRDLFRALMDRPRPSEVVTLPVHWEMSSVVPKVRIVVLRNDEFDDARMGAAKIMRDKYGLSGDDLGAAGRATQSDWVARHILARAMHYVEPVEGTEGSPGGPHYPKIYTCAEDVAKSLHPDELGVLAAHYSSIQEKKGPIESAVHTDEEVTAWIDVLAKGAKDFPLDRLGSLDVAALAQSFAERLYCMSAIHEFPPENSQSILDALPTSWRIGTGFYGAGVANSILAKLHPSDWPDDGPYPYSGDDDNDGSVAMSVAKKAAPAMTAEEASRLARTIGQLTKE